MLTAPSSCLLFLFLPLTLTYYHTFLNHCVNDRYPNTVLRLDELWLFFLWLTLAEKPKVKQHSIRPFDVVLF